MTETDPFFKCVIESIKVVTKQKNIDTSQFAVSTPLTGSESPLDSLDLVMLIVELERAVQVQFNITINLSDAAIANPETSPFKTVGTLIKKIKQSLSEVNN